MPFGRNGNHTPTHGGAARCMLGSEIPTRRATAGTTVDLAPSRALQLRRPRTVPAARDESAPPARHNAVNSTALGASTPTRATRYGPCGTLSPLCGAGTTRTGLSVPLWCCRVCMWEIDIKAERPWYPARNELQARNWSICDHKIPGYPSAMPVGGDPPGVYDTGSIGS